SGLEFVDGSEHAAHQAPAREFGKEAFDGVEPGCRGWGEVEGPARMPGKPGAHLGMFVSGVVVDDGVDRFSLRYPSLDGVEEADELLMAVALHVVPDDGAVEYVEGGEQRRGAVTLVVVGAARLHWQPGLSSVERLDLAFLTDREAARVVRRVDIEADNVLEFLRELRIVRQLERADAVGCELVG